MTISLTPPTVAIDPFGIVPSFAGVATNTTWQWVPQQTQVSKERRSTGFRLYGHRHVCESKRFLQDLLCVEDFRAQKFHTFCYNR